jgi:hypothetical protein
LAGVSDIGDSVVYALSLERDFVDVEDAMTCVDEIGHDVATRFTATACE